MAEGWEEEGRRGVWGLVPRPVGPGAVLSARRDGGGVPGCLAPGRVGVLSAPCGAGGDSADPYVGWFMTGARSCCWRKGSP